ncbi:hypothetical protein Golomagni_06720 [Golovinomyces magnicellulatus]|nr:hypothetical protein Golomagni_06720 [Golovinomyces magnicellulatus]
MFAMSKPEFTHDPSVEPWNKPYKQWLTDNEKTWNGVATSAFVFDENRMLLVQRAPDDSMPNLWEPPGGAVDPEDVSILAGCAREVFEEAGLKVKRVKANVTLGLEKPELRDVFTNGAGNRLFVRFGFLVDVDEAEVKLDPIEHQAYVWATEEDVKRGRISIGDSGDDLFIPITTLNTKKFVMEAFRLRKLETSS